MVNYEVIINPQRCKGCDYCVAFCPSRCLERPGDSSAAWGDRSARLGSGFGSGVGYAAPAVVHPELCKGCGICTWMCPHWAIEVNRSVESPEKSIIKERVAGPPSLLSEPPFAGCPGCQQPTVGRIIAEALEELGLSNKSTVFDSIPCSISSTFGMDFSRKVKTGENSLDLAVTAKKHSPDNMVVVTQGYWGLSDFSFNFHNFINTLVRGDKTTLILCNMPFYSPRYGRPSGLDEPAEGRLEPVTTVNQLGGDRVISGGEPPRIAEIATMFKGTVYSARGTLATPGDYRLTKKYVLNALRKQIDNAGFSLVEILMVCTDSSYSAPVNCLKWVKDKMTATFPPGELKNS